LRQADAPLRYLRALRLRLFRSCRFILRRRPRPVPQEASVEVEIAGAKVLIGGRPGAEALADMFRGGLPTFS
jgi:hypothetical protein